MLTGLSIFISVKLEIIRKEGLISDAGEEDELLNDIVDGLGEEKKEEKKIETGGDEEESAEGEL